MRNRHCSFIFCLSSIILCTAFVLQPLNAQEAVAVDSRSLMAHVVSRVPLVYPAIAKAAHVEGTVVVEMKLGKRGEVVSTHPVSGPPMLIQAAVDSVKQWRFRPFLRNGEPAFAVGRVNLIFSLGDEPQPASPKGISETPGSSYTVKVTLKPGASADIPDPKIASKYFPLWNSCTEGVLAHKNDSETASVCRQAADFAEEFPPNEGFIEKRSSEVYAATSLANIADLKSALTYAEKAVAEVKLGHDDDSGENAAYSVRGHIRAFLGDMAGSDQDLNTAEDFERKAVGWAKKESPGIALRYRHVLQRDLEFHAEVLKRMNRPQDAQKKLDEASKL